MILQSIPVGVPALVALALGFVAFEVAFWRTRVQRPPEEPGAGQRAKKSWVGILVQGLGMGIASFGRIRVELPATSAAALAQALLVALLMAGVAGLFGWSARTMGPNWSLEARTRADHTLVTTGPFAIVRHPIYVALFLLMLAFAVAFGHPRNLVLGVPLFALGTWLRIREEEALLARAFGADYTAYAARVKRFVPGLF